MRYLPSVLAALTLMAATSAAQVDALLDSLAPTGYVNDYAGVLAPQQRQSIESLLTELEQKTTAEVSIVTIRSTEGVEISDFAVRLFERWGIGQADEDNGVLLVAAIEDRNVWIEVGYGLEPVINDALAGRILDQAVVPYFRDGDYGSGLGAGASALAFLIAEDQGVELSGTPLSGPPRTVNEAPRSGLIQLIVILVAVLIFWRNPWLGLLLLSSGRGGGFRGGGGFGRGSGGGFGGFGGGMSGGGGAGRSW